MADDPLNSTSGDTRHLDTENAPATRTDLDTEASALAARQSQEAKQQDFDLQAANLLPTALRVIQDAMEGDDPKEALAAAKLLLRNQGRLVDRVQTVDKDALTILLEAIRQPRPIIKTLPNPKDYVDGASKKV